MRYPAGSRSSRDPWRWGIAFVVSAALHAGALSLRFSAAEGGGGRFLSRASRAWDGAIRVHDLVPVEDGGAERPVEAEDEPPRERRDAPPLGTEAPAPSRQPLEIAPRRADDVAPAVRLAPRLRDARLWGSERSLGDASGLDFTGEPLSLFDRIVAYHDSMGAAGETVPGMTDWTGEGSGDGRWGLAPGRIYLGGLVIPTCGGSGVSALDCGFGVLPNRRAEHAERFRVFSEIRGQAHQMDLRDVLRARAGAIRARRDAERRDTMSVRHR